MTIFTIRAVLKLIAAEFGVNANITPEEREDIRANLDKIYRYSKHNDIAHLVGYTLVKNNLISESDECFEAFESEHYLAMLRRERQDFELSRICEAFECAGIDFIPLKGAILKDLYPEPWMRTSCDIDILVKNEDLDAARECMLETLRYKKGKESMHDESFDCGGSVNVELHFALVEEGNANNAGQIVQDVWSHTQNAPGKKHHKLMSDEMFYFYHVAHMAKHFEKGGIGVRHFLDLYLLDRDTSNAEQREELLARGGLGVFGSVARKLAQSWFGGAELDAISGRAETFVLSCGAYGTRKNAILLATEKCGGGRRYILNRVFMPYDVIKYAYPILKKHKWLFPFYQLVRWLKLLSFKRVKSAANEIRTTSSLSENEYKKLRNLMIDVGLK